MEKAKTVRTSIPKLHHHSQRPDTGLVAGIHRKFREAGPPEVPVHENSHVLGQRLSPETGREKVRDSATELRIVRASSSSQSHTRRLLLFFFCERRGKFGVEGNVVGTRKQRIRHCLRESKSCRVGGGRKKIKIPITQ